MALNSKILALSALLIGTSALSFQAQAAECTTKKDGLKALLGGKEFAPKWEETTADDGKPLKIEMADRGEKLYFVYDKTNEGIWAEGFVTVCKEGNGVVAKISKQDIKVGEKAPRLVKWSMGKGASFKMQLKDADHMHVSTTGWKGDFVAKK